MCCPNGVTMRRILLLYSIVPGCKHISAHCLESYILYSPMICRTTVPKNRRLKARPVRQMYYFASTNRIRSYECIQFVLLIKIKSFLLFPPPHQSVSYDAFLRPREFLQSPLICKSLCKSDVRKKTTRRKEKTLKK